MTQENNVQRIMVVGDAFHQLPAFLALMGKEVVCVDSRKSNSMDSYTDLIRFRLRKRELENISFNVRSVHSYIQDLNPEEHGLEPNSFDLITFFDLVPAAVGKVGDWVLKSKEVLKEDAYIVVDEYRRFSGKKMLGHVEEIFSNVRLVNETRFSNGRYLPGGNNRLYRIKNTGELSAIAGATEMTVDAACKVIEENVPDISEKELYYIKKIADKILDPYFEIMKKEGERRYKVLVIGDRPRYLSMLLNLVGRDDITTGVIGKIDDIDRYGFVDNEFDMVVIDDSDGKMSEEDAARTLERLKNTLQWFTSYVSICVLSPDEIKFRVSEAFNRFRLLGRHIEDLNGPAFDDVDMWRVSPHPARIKKMEKAQNLESTEEVFRIDAMMKAIMTSVSAGEDANIGELIRKGIVADKEEEVDIEALVKNTGRREGKIFTETERYMKSLAKESEEYPIDVPVDLSAYPKRRSYCKYTYMGTFGLKMQKYPEYQVYF